MKKTTIHLLSALCLTTALSGCLSTGGGSGTNQTPGGGTSGGGAGGGTGGGSGGGTGGGTGGSFDQAAFDETYDRVSAMTYTPSAPASLQANYKGQFSMHALDPNQSLTRVIFVQGDLDLDLDYNPATPGAAQIDVWSGGATNLTGKAVVGQDETPIVVTGEMPVMANGPGANNNLVASYPLVRWNAFLDGSGATIEGEQVDGTISLAGDFKGDTMEAAVGGMSGNVDIGSGNTNFIGTAYLERQ